VETSVFDRSQRRQVSRAAALAESLTSGFYCIPGREWPRFPYDISTLAEGPGPEAPVFADVVRMPRSRAPRPGSAARDLYRIRLRDDEILSAIQSGTDLELYPLLLYVLTHELVHVVRFESGFAAYDTDDPELRSEEEKRVHTITRKVLRPAENDALIRVARLYREHEDDTHFRLRRSGPTVET
jgi:hypothetical protein